VTLVADGRNIPLDVDHQARGLSPLTVPIAAGKHRVTAWYGTQAISGDMTVPGPPGAKYKCSLETTSCSWK
jgi:hypothetical protein